MKVNVKCLAQLSKEKVCDHHGSTPHEIADGTTVRGLAQHLELNLDDISIIFLNHREVEMDAVLKEGDSVAFAPKSGGM